MSVLSYLTGDTKELAWQFCLVLEVNADSAKSVLEGVLLCFKFLNMQFNFSLGFLFEERLDLEDYFLRF